MPFDILICVYWYVNFKSNYPVKLLCIIAVKFCDFVCTLSFAVIIFMTYNLTDRWQHLWHNSTSNKLHNIYPTLPINSNYPTAQLTCQEQTLCNRLWIGHTYLTDSYLLKYEDPPICISCNSLLTVEHQLYRLDIIHQNFYTASNLKDLFHNIHPKCIISFVHAIGLTNKH